MTIRVLFATPFWQERSGPEESLLTLITSTAFAGDVDPIVALPPGAAYVDRFRSAGVETVEYHADLFRRRRSFLAVACWTRSVARARGEAASLLRRLRPDIAHSNMETTFGLALAAGGQNIPHVHHVRSISFSRPKVAGDLLLRAVCRYSDAQIAISSTVADLFPAGSNPDVIENPVADELFTMSRLRKRQRPVVLALGRVNPRKNLELFLEVAARTTVDAEFRIVGPVEPEDTSYLAILRQRASSLGISDRVTFAGSLPAVEALADADLVLNAGGNEGFCRVVAEAMAAAVASVARVEGATNTLVDDGRTGRLFSSPEDGAVAVDELLRSAAMRSKVGRAARAEAQNRFSADRAAGRVLDVYRRLMAPVG